MGWIGDAWDWLCDKAKQVWNGLFGSSESTAREVGDSEVYDIELATARETARINEALSDFKNNAGDQAYKLEEQLSEICENIFDELLEQVEKMNNQDFCGSTLHLPTRKIRADNRRILRNLRGNLKQEILPKISIDNPECLEILKMQKGEDKKNRMLNFINRILIRSINNLRHNLDNDIKDGIEYTQEQIEAGLENIEGIFQDNLNSLKLLQENVGDIDGSEREQIGVAFILWKMQYLYQNSKIIKKEGGNQ